LEIRFHKRHVSFVVVKIVMCKRVIWLRYTIAFDQILYFCVCDIFVFNRKFKRNCYISCLIFCFNLLFSFFFQTDIALMYDALDLYDITLRKLQQLKPLRFNHRSIPCDTNNVWLFGSDLIQALKNVRKRLYNTCSVCAQTQHGCVMCIIAAVLLYVFFSSISIFPNPFQKIRAW